MKIILMMTALALFISSPTLAADPVPLYYQAPGGTAFYAAAPKKTPDGRAYVPVFEDQAATPLGAAAPVAPAKASPDRRVLYYRNPMGQPDTSPAPKKDSMGMDYLPVYADENAAGDPPGLVRITPGRIQMLGVRTEAAALRPPLSRDVRATGNVQFDERRLATVTTKVGGWIERLVVAATGDAVKRGQVMAELYAPDLVASEEEYLVAVRMGGAMAHGGGGILAAAAMQRLRALDVPEDELARLRKTGVAARRIAVRALRDGVVIDKPVQEGMRVEAGQALFKTADLSGIWLIAEVQEQDLGAIQPGQQATVNFVAFPGRSFTGTVDFIYPSLSLETRTGRVRIIVANADGTLRAAMYANVQIVTGGSSEPVLTVPDSAILDSGSRQAVLIDRGDGRFEPRPVRLGAHGDGRVQVLEGVQAGDKVVVSANFLIDAESNLRAALQSFGNPADTPGRGAAGTKP